MKFKELQQHDMPLLKEWLQRSHVKEWWDDGNDTLEKVQNHYTSNPDTTKRFLLLDSTEVPIGYFQYYIAFERIGIDQFLADKINLGKGLGTEAVRAFISMIRKRHNPAIIVTDPSPENTRAIRCYEKAGFQHLATVSDYNGKIVYLMEIKY